MIVKYSLAVVLVFGLALAALKWMPRPDPLPANGRLAGEVLKALENEDYEAFIARSDKSVKKIDPEDFRQLAQHHAPRLKRGHALQPLDARWLGTVHVSRWKLTFNDGGRDAVLTIGVRDGRVATIAIF